MLVGASNDVTVEQGARVGKVGRKMNQTKTRNFTYYAQRISNYWAKGGNLIKKKCDIFKIYDFSHKRPFFITRSGHQKT